MIKKAPANAPAYVKELDEITPKQKKVLEYAFRVGNDYDIKTAKPVETEKSKRLGYHLAAIAWMSLAHVRTPERAKKVIMLMAVGKSL
ncbi:hypothetical protein IANJMKHF_00218 [Klebsiella phage CPRSA]|nr:hypothetical protein IANJMKHF_00218 [Klebsiella phage CPRSA]